MQIVRIPTESIQHGVSEALNIYLASTSRLDGDNHAPAPMLRNEELETLFALSRSLTEVLDTGEVLNRVVEASVRHRLGGLLLSRVLAYSTPDVYTCPLPTVQTSCSAGSVANSAAIAPLVSDWLPLMTIR